MNSIHKILSLKDKNEWRKHKPRSDRIYKNGIKGVQKNGNDKWKFVGYSYKYSKFFRKCFDTKSQAIAYAKKVWDSYPQD